MSDLIDRQQALEKVRTMQTYKLFEDISLVDKAVVQTELMILPPIQPEKRTEERTETHACDCISRQAAIDAVGVNSWAGSRISNLPSVQPEPHEGEWIVHLYKVGVNRYECDTCHARCDIIYPYCPYCGEKKEGERYAIN